MRIFSQTKLLLWKNLVLRYRRPGILVLEVLWPILVVGIIAVMRLAVPPTKQGNCHYQPRALPSSGAIPFLQTYLCNLDNPCYTSDVKIQRAYEASQQFSAMTENLGPLLGSDEIIDVLEVSNKTSNVYTMIKKAVGNKELLHGLENIMNVSSYFRDPDKVKSILVDDYNLLTEPEADALMKSRIDVGQLTSLTGSPDFKDIACDANKLDKYVQLPAGADVEKLSNSLCNVTEDKTVGLANLMIRELNMTTIFHAMKLMEEVKESFLDEHNILSYSFEMIAQMFEVVTESNEVMKLLGTFTGIPDIASFIRKIPEFVGGFQDFDSIMTVLKDVVFNLEPLMKNLGVDDSPIWLTVKDAATLGANFMKLTNGKWNGTSEEFMQPLKSLLTNIEDMAHDKEGKMFIAFFEFLTKIDMVKAYDEVIYTQGLSESTIKTMLKAMQEMFEKMSVWESMKPMVRINEHMFDVIAILSEKSVDLKHALKSLFDSNDVLKNEIKKIFAYGPAITHTVLDAFVNNEIFTAIANEEMYDDICRRALTNLQSRIPFDVYQDVRNTLCPGTGNDVVTEINKLLKNLKLSAISKVINETIVDFEKLYEGEFFRSDVQLVEIYDHYVRFTNAFNSYIYDDYKWFQVFEGVYMGDIDFNERGWEPVTDMLDENFLTTLTIGSFQLIGKAFADSPLADEFAPTIHTMSGMVKLVYETLADVNELTARDTPLMELANMVTKYSPEIVNGVTYLLDTNNDMVFKLLASEDPLKTFCNDRFLYKMSLPNYVPITDLNNLVCKSDWNRIVDDMALPAKRIEAFIPKMVDIVNAEYNQTYSIETDWIQIQDYSERLFDMISMGQILGVIDMRTTTVEFFGQLDLSRMDETLNALNRLMMKMMTEDTMMGMEIAYKVISMMDAESSEDMSLSDMFKASMVTYESYLDQMIESIKNPKGLDSMMALLSGLPPSVRDMVILMSKSYPQFVSAAADNLYDPSKLTTKILALRAANPDCETTFVSDYLSLPRGSDFHKFETYLCQLNFTEFMEDLFMSQFSIFMGGNEMFNKTSNGSMVLPDVDWQRLQQKNNEFTNLIMSESENLAMSPFNTTAINMAWDKFYRASDTLAKLGSKKVEHLVEDIMKILSISVDDSNDTGLENFFYGSMYLSGEFTRAIINELSVFNTSSPVILVDHLGSEELKKLTDLLVVSPDVNAVGVATLYRLLSSPQKAMFSTDFESMCHNLTLFSEVFVVTASPMDPADLQSTVCHALATVNITLMFEQLADRPMFQTIENAMQVTGEQNITVMKQGYLGGVESAEKLSELIEKIVRNPPTIKLTASDDAWMDAEVYAREWENFGRQLSHIFDENMNGSLSKDLGAIVSHVAVESLKSLPEAPQIFGYIDAFVDITQNQLDNSADFFERYNKYPGTSAVIDLMNHAPGAIQTLLYTVLRQSQKLEAWSNALQSWQSFCATPADTIFSVPHGLQFSMSDFKNKMCSIDGEQLLRELGEAQKADKLESLFSGDSDIRGNATITEEKLRRLVESFTQQMTSTSDDDLARSFNLRLFNETVWVDVSKRVVTWMNDTAADLMSPEKISLLVASTLKDIIEGTSPESSEMINKGMAIADVVMGELLDILKSNSLDEAFQDLPSMQPFIYLLNSVPELFETILYTGTVHPEKISMKLQTVQSFEGFCANNPEEMFSMPPQSSFDAKQWMDTLCSINETVLEQFMDYKTATHIQDIIENSLNKSVDIKELMDKTNKLMDTFAHGIPLNERVFDAGVWQSVMEDINSWMADLGTNEQIFSLVERSVSSGVIGLLQSMPETTEAFHYIDAILGIVGDRIDSSRADIKKAFDGFPTITTLFELLEQSPEIIETVLYTVMTQPEKTAAWSSSMQSWTRFCSTPSADIMKVPSGSKFDVSAFLAKMCTVDIDQLVTELNTYQGAERIKMISMGNDTTAFNATSMIETVDKLLESVEHISMGDNVPDLRLLNTTVWDQLGMRMGQWLNEAGATYGSEASIVMMINQVYTSTLAQNPEARDVFTRILAITGLITDQTIDFLQTGYINSTLGESPTLQNLVNLAENVPELLEVLVYSGLKHPEKLTSAANNVMSLEDFCMSSPENLFTIPPGVNFDLTGWLTQLCALNLTDVENQLVEQKSAKDIEAIIMGTRGSDANITSVVGRIDKLMKLIEDGPTFHDRFLDTSVWSKVMSRLRGWMEDPDFINSNSMMSYVSGVFGVIDQLSQQPGMGQVLQPLSVAMQIVDNMMDNILQLPNKTSIQGKDLFAGWQGMVNTLKFIQTPGVLDTLFASAGDYQKFMPLTSEEGLKDFCDPNTAPTKYLTIPADSTVDLQKVKTAFCDINFDRYMDGVDSFIDFKTLEGISNGSLTFDWKAFESKLDRFSDLLMKWEKQPPTFNLPPHWMDESYWNTLFETSLATLPEKLTAKEQIVSIVTQLGPLLDTDGFKQVGMILNKVLDILNFNIKSLQEARLTLGSLIESVPALKNLFDAVGVDSETLRSVALAPIKNTEQFMQLFMSSNVQNDFCNTDKWTKAIDFPSDFNTSGLVETICGDDPQAILVRMEDNFQLTDTLKTLMDDTSRVKDWTEATGKIFDLVDNFELLIENPPTLNADETLSILSENYNMTNLFKLTSAFSVLGQLFNESDNGRGVDDMIAQTSGQLENVVGLVIGVLDSVLGRVKIQDGRLDIAALFKDVPEVQAIIKGILEMKPDPLTGLFAVVLRADKISDFISMSDNPSKLKELFCDKPTFERVFQIRNGVDVNRLLTALCKVDFDQVGEELKNSFLPTDDMSKASSFNMETFSKHIEDVISQLTNVTSLEHVVYNGTDLAKIFVLNSTRLMEMWEHNDFGNVPEDYVALTTQILNSVLNEMDSSSRDVKTLAASFKFMALYLESFNSFLRSIKDKPIHLSMLLNNTEVGAILNPILTNLDSLNALVDMTVDVKKLDEMIEGPSPQTTLCSDDLFHAFKIPANEMAPFKDLQTHVCSTNSSVLLWQTVMMQANGYFLHEQMEIIEKEIADGKTSINTTAVAVDMEGMVSLMQTIIGQYVDGSRSFSDLIDVNKIKDVLENTQKNIADKLLVSSQEWSLQLADIVLPKVLDQSSLVTISKALNTVNLFMNLTITQLQAMNDGRIDVSDFFMRADGLQHTVEAYIRLAVNISQAWSNNEFDVNKMQHVFNDTSLAITHCKHGDLAQYIARDSTPSQTVMDFSTVVCSIMGAAMTDDVKAIIGYNEIGDLLMTIWEDTQAKPDYATFVRNVQTFTSLIQELSAKSNHISTSLLDAFHIEDALDSLQNIAQNPQKIFQVLKLFGMAIDDPLSHDTQAVKSLSQMNSFVLMPMVRFFEALKAKGLTVTNMADNPNAFLDMMSVLADFDFQFASMKEFVVKPRISTLSRYKDELCRSQNYRDAARSRLAMMTNLPVPVDDVLSIVCTHNSSTWLDEFQRLGFTNTEMVVVFDKLVPEADVFDMYVDPFKWTDLMSSLEKLSGLISDSGVKSGSKMDDVKSAWNATKDILFDKGFTSLFSYLEIAEISAPPMDSDWIVFKQFMRFLTSTMETIDTNVQRVADNGQVIQLKDALPDPQRVADIFARIMGGQNAAEFLITAVDPVMFFRLSVSDSWEDICKDKDSILDYFHFPDGTDVNGLTESLCHAVTARTAAFEEMLSLFGAKDMFKQLDMLIHRQWNASNHDSVYDHTHAAMMHLIKTLEKVQHSSVDAGNMEAYLQPIIMVLQQQQQQTFGMCNAIVGYLNKTRDFKYFHDIFSRVFTGLNLASDMAKIVPSMDDLACSLNDENEISLKKFVNKLVGLGVIDSVENAVKSLILPPSELQCSAPLSFSEALMEVINATVVNNELDIDRMHRCTEDTSVKFRKVISSASGLLDFIKQLVGAMQTPSIQKLLNDPQLMTAFNFFSNAIDSNANRMIKFEDLLINKTSATSHLTNVLAIPRSVATAIMNSTVNPNSTNFLRQSEDMIQRTLCDPLLLSKTLIIPGSGVNSSDISRIICGNNIADTVNYLKNVSVSPKQVAEDNGLMTIVVDLTNGLADLVANFDGIMRLFVDLSTKQDINVMGGHVDVIDDIIQGNVMERFGESLKKIFYSVKPFFSKDASTQDVIHDVEKVIDGIIAIEVVVKGPVVETLEVEDLVLNVTSLKMYLQNELKFSPELTDTILHSVFSARVFFGLEDKQAYSCDEVFDMLLVMNGTGVSPSEVSQAFCQLNEKELTDLVNSLKMELDIGKLIAKYVSYTTNSVMASTNMTKEELNDMVNKIDKSQVVIQKATDEFKKFQNGSNILNIFGGANADAFTSLDKLTPIMCGETVDRIFDNGFGGAVIVTSPDSFLEDIHNGIDHDVDDLPNEFCVDIYKNVRSSDLGSIIWAYVKPIMRGKILYTPDNEITRAIIQKANDTFKTLDEVNRIASIWAKQAPNLETMTVSINETDGLRDALENDFIKGLLESTVGVEATDVLTGLDALQSNNFDKEDLTALQSLAEIIANYTSCVDLNRFVPLATEKDLEMEAFRLSKTDTFWAGIVFENVGDSTPTSGRRKRQSIPNIPKHVTYKIRMDVDNVMDTTRLKAGLYTMSAEDSFIEDLRYLRGFIYIQDILDTSIIDFHKNPVMKTPGVKIRQMPFPCHHYDGFIFMLGSYLIPIMMTFVFLASIGTATHNLTYDRENGQEQTLSVMGMISGLNFMSWFITTMALMTIVCGILAIMLKYTDIFIYSNPFIIFLFLLTFCFSSVNLLYMISAFFNRTTLAILFVLMVYLISYLPFILVVSLELTMEPWQKNLACLASTTAFSFGSHNMGYLEDTGKGAQWSNLKEEGAKDYSMHWACMMMLIDSAIYLVIGWYVRHVKPGKYGVPKPWYFPILPSFWCGCFNCGPTGNKYLAPRNPEHSKGSLFEAAPPDHAVGIEVNNLSKAYGKTKVLHDLTIDFYEGQISCLLGHNGAAKTTTLKLFCGVLDPTTGSVLLNGRKPGSGNHSLGICPQQNALFNYMSVLEHMEFYSEMKGTHVTLKRMQEVKKLLRDVDLWHVRNVSAGDLSYGMKRRLCVALAFVGESKTVILDEPTSGVDPHARKNIWNLISSNRLGRTILLSTHHLDEADILSDRIAILHKGRLMCSGSPSFLKRQMGGGYKLTVSKSTDTMVQNVDGAQPDVGDSASDKSSIDGNILSYIQTMCPTARISESMGTEIVVDLPKDETLMNVSLPVFFQDLDRRAKDLGIANYGLTDTKVEDIFLQLTLDMEKNDRGVDNPAMVPDVDTSVPIPDTPTPSSNAGPSRPRLPSDSALFKPGARIHHDPSFQLFAPQQSVDTKKRRTGASLAWSQLAALLVKRFHHYRRNWRMLITCVILPLIAFMIAIGFSTIRPDEGDQRPLVLDPIIYGEDSYTFLGLAEEVAQSNKAVKLAKSFRNSSIGIGTSCMSNTDDGDWVVNPSCEKGSAPYGIQTPLYSVSCADAVQEYTVINGFRVNYQQQDLPNEVYLQNLDRHNIPRFILKTFRDFKDKRFGGWSLEQPYENDDPAEYDPYVWFNSKGYHSMPSFLSGLSNSILRANLPFYENPDEYGITAINHPIRLGRSPLTLKTLENDAADAGISVMVVLAFSFIPCGFILYIINERNQKEKQLQQISGVGTFMYWMVSWLWDMFVYLIAVGISVAIVVIFETDSFYIRDNLSAFAVTLIMYGWAMIPYIYLVSRFFKSASTAYLVTFCTNLFLAMATIISLLVMQLFREDDVIWKCYKICRYAFLVFPQFALGQGLMDMVSSTVKYKLFLRFNEDFYDNPFEYDITGYKLIAMAIFGFVFFVLNLLAEKIHGRALRISKNHSETSSEIDEDVAKEKDRVRQNPRGDLLQVNDLSKVYRRGWKKFAAVDHINFGIQEGESFGLLGVNGAGKTTTFRMLTGDLGSSGGTVMFNGRKISSHDRHFGQSVGYCPQEGGLDQYLTGRETLHFHARLRGFDGEQSKELVDQLLSRLGLMPYAKKAVHTYSEGTKRKLALAVAMLGDPPILYLDEPTTGMDAATRRQAWKCIAQANLNGQSVVLTSHTMDECDALCGRIAIMVNGQIKCIGSPQHLKNKFGDGYTAVVHSQKDNLGGVSHFFLNHFPGSLIRTKHHSSLEIMIPHSCGILADILAVLQRSQQEGMIEYYSLSQTTLDAVFISFAQDQTDTFEEGTVTNSSIEDKSFTPRSSVSYDKPPSYDGQSSDKKDTPYVFSNPQFVLNEDENEIAGEPTRPRYVSNITLAAEMAAVPTSDAETGEDFSTRL